MLTIRVPMSIDLIYPPRVLVAFESSTVVRDAFRRAGFSAWSCDLLPADTECQDYHLQMDALAAIESDHWDMVIAHPECTSLAVSGNHVYAKGKPKHQERLDQVAYVEDLWDRMTSGSKFVVLENPTGVLPTLSNLPKPTYVQPYQFGEDASKRTGLFLHGLPAMIPGVRVPGRLVNGVERWANQTDSGQNRLGPSPTRWKERSRTYPGIADAMVENWAKLLWIDWL